MKKTKVVLLSFLMLSVVFSSAVKAETNILEAAAPNGWVFQYFYIDQHAEAFAQDEMAVGDMDLDVNMNLFRLAYWDTNYVVHAIVPYGFVDQRVEIAGGPTVVDGDTDGIGDMFIGGAKRWNVEPKSFWILGGMDLRLPTGRYDSRNDSSCTDFAAFGNPNIGSGSTSFQPFFILSKLYNEGMIGHDTEIRYDFNTDLGPAPYDPDDKLEIWQTLHMGINPNLRAGITFKGEWENANDDGGKDADNVSSSYMGLGPEVMWNNGKGVVVWAKLLFDIDAEDHPEDMTAFTLRVSLPF